jgi:hypothetical protein
MSRWPPRIIAKLSAWWKKRRPQQRDRLLAGVDQVVVLLPGAGAGPMPRMPFSLCRKISRSRREVVGHQRRQADAQVHVGAVGMSRATRAAIWSLHALHR